MATVVSAANGDVEVKLQSERALPVIMLPEKKTSRLLMAYIGAGVTFMLLPGTFLGVWNLFAISGRHVANSVSPAWIQAHGHAQIFGWIGSFILGIGYFSLPRLRRVKIFGIGDGWICWLLWTLGVGLRWTVNVNYSSFGFWRVLLPLSAAFELSGFLIFLNAVTRHRPAGGDKRVEPWMIIVISGTIGLLVALLLNFGAAIYAGVTGASPAFPSAFNQHFLSILVWGFLVLFVWGFSARWFPVFLGLRKLKAGLLLLAPAAVFISLISGFIGLQVVSAAVLCFAVVLSMVALRLFEPSCKAAKVRGVHFTFPIFVRLAYMWLIASVALGLWAAATVDSGGIAGASRHAVTVGFLSTMVFCVGPRVLPAFAGRQRLFSTKLMFGSLALLTIGCALRVTSEVLAYQGFLENAWSWLPVSAVIELAAVGVFALNMVGTFLQRTAVGQAL